MIAHLRIRVRRSKWQAATAGILCLASLASAGVILLSSAACAGSAPGQAASGAGSQGTIDGPDGLGDVPKQLDWEDSSPGWSLPGPKLLLTGTIFQADGRTPAKDVVLYYYQTNLEGRYVHRPEEPRSMPPNELGQTHGYIRGWVRTGADGKYAIYTVRPGTYPSRSDPAHVHATIREPGLADYYIDDFVFDDDPLLTSARRLRMENRGGCGVLRLVREDDLFIGERDIVLGQCVPNHPAWANVRPQSGRRIAEDVVSFTPFHAWGPDKGSRTCPVCKYGRYHGILYFVGNDPDWDDVRRWLTFLEAESARREGRLKVYFVYGNERGYDQTERTRELERLGQELRLERLALTFVPSFTDEPSDVAHNRIDPDARNTFLLYKRSRIFDKAVDLPATDESFRWISKRLDRSRNEYFELPR
jgi:protocatechuate 3,4-dioxygenase beta subunit